MTPALRKRHQRTWWFLGFALLLIWGASTAVINKNKGIKNQPSVIPSEEIKVSIKNGPSSNTQKISVQINRPLSSPQTMVYLTDNENNEIEKCQLLGRIDGTGIFDFPLDSVSIVMPQKIIKGYDAIHQKELFSVVLDND